MVEARRGMCQAACEKPGDGFWNLLQSVYGPSVPLHCLAAPGLQVVFYDGDPSCSEPLSFRDVFLESMALEHIVASLVSHKSCAQAHQSRS